VLAAIRHHLLDFDQHDAGGARKEFGQHAALMDAGRAVDAQACAIGEIDEQTSDARIAQDIAEAHECTVAVEIREYEAVFVQNLDQPRAAALEGTVAVSVGRTGGEEEERGALDPGMQFGWDAVPQQALGGGRRPTGIRFASAAAGPFRRD
jgi:hypothetical protein